MENIYHTKLSCFIENVSNLLSRIYEYVLFIAIMNNVGTVSPRFMNEHEIFPEDLKTVSLLLTAVFKVWRCIRKAFLCILIMQSLLSTIIYFVAIGYEIYPRHI